LFLYSIKGQSPKGVMIIKFRAWVSKGIFFNKEKNGKI
jgi:hypothetical protein